MTHSESLDRVSFSPWTARYAEGIPSLSERDSWLDFLLCENTAAGLPAPVRKWDELDLSFLCRSDKLVIVRYLPLSPLSTVVKSAYSIIAHHPNPIQKWKSQCSQLNHKSMSSSVCGRTLVWTLYCSFQWDRWAHNLLECSFVISTWKEQWWCRVWSVRGVCGKGRAMREQQRFRMRHGVPDVKIVVLSRHKHSLDITQKADTHLLWIVAGAHLARMDNRRNWGRSRRWKGRSAGARWKCAGHLRCDVRHVARSMIYAHCLILSLEQSKMDDYLTTLPNRLCAWEKCVR